MVDSSCLRIVTVYQLFSCGVLQLLLLLQAVLAVLGPHLRERDKVSAPREPGGNPPKQTDRGKSQANAAVSLFCGGTERAETKKTHLSAVCSVTNPPQTHGRTEGSEERWRERGWRGRKKMNRGREE